jgi:hypothetical protein
LLQVGRCASWLSSSSKSRSQAAGIICLSIEGACYRTLTLFLPFTRGD